MSELSREILATFEKQREYMEERINSGIEANRKGVARFTVVDKEGNPLPHAHVELHQKTHDFRFGANLFMLDELESDEKNAAYKEAFGELFNLAVLPFYWHDLEPEQGKPRFAKDSPKIYRRPAPDLCLEFCAEHGIEPKLHCLNYDQCSPTWLPNEVETVKQLLDKRMGEIAARYADKIPTMEVTNETLCGPCCYENRRSTAFFKEDDIVEWSFKQARHHLPNNKLIINEAQQYVWGSFKHNRSPYYMQIERALANGAPIDVIGMQYHVFNRENYFDAELLYNVMDLFARFGKPLQVTEITVPAYSDDPLDEELQAQLITTLYKIWFSHPSMEAIIYWNLVDGYAGFAKQGDMTAGENRYYGALMRFDLSKKPAFHALNTLINETWRTHISTDVGETPLTVKGFYGEYEVTVTVGGKSVTQTVHLQKGGENTFTLSV